MLSPASPPEYQVAPVAERATPSSVPAASPPVVTAMSLTSRFGRPVESFDQEVPLSTDTRMPAFARPA